MEIHPDNESESSVEDNHYEVFHQPMQQQLSLADPMVSLFSR
jgi:hypothetical protein